jgi:MFS family permease
MSTTLSSAARPADIRLGLRENWPQFALLVLVNAFVGMMAGLERTVVPLLAEEVFGIASKSVLLSFIVSFGVVKAGANLVAGGLAERVGRKPLLVAGWFAALPVPVMIILAPSWSWIVVANLLLGLNQGLAWSATVIMKIDLVGSKQRGLAMGLNESAGYVAVALSAALTGYLASTFALRPYPFYFGIGVALVGLLLSIFFVRETRGHARLEARGAPVAAEATPSFRSVLALVSWRNRTLFAATQAGLVNNLNDGVVWGLMPLLLAGAGLDLAEIGLVVALYPAVWGLTQMATGALSDRWGRKGLIAGGLWVQAVGIFLLARGHGYGVWLAASALMGVGTAMVYPTLLATVSDVAHPSWRASAIGVYRLWRDLGYAVGALLAGILADRMGIEGAILVVGVLTALSGGVVAGGMSETLPGR